MAKNVLHHEEPQTDVMFPKLGEVNGNITHSGSGLSLRKIGRVVKTLPSNHIGEDVASSRGHHCYATASIRRLGATLSLAYRGSLGPGHILHELLAGSPDGYRERLKSRRPFVLAARKLLQDLTELDIRAAQWTDFKWSTEYSECSSFIPRTSTRPMEMGLPRSSWVRLNRLRTGVGCFQSFMHKWGLVPTSNCECGAVEQIAEHIILTCPVHWAPTGIRGLTVLDVDTRCWLSTITASI